MKSITHRKSVQTLYMFLAGIGGINCIILIHEMGHYLFAQLFNVPTPLFSLGFGPTLFSFHLGKTMFQIAALPLGGYVQINQEILTNQTYLAQMLILFGGILSNMLFAYGILLYYTRHNYFILIPTINSITAGSPADQAGLQSHDSIVTYNHQPIHDPEEMIRSIALSYGKTIILMIKRENTEQEISIPLNQPHPLFGNNTGWLGVEFQKQQTEGSFLSTLHGIHKKIIKTTQEICHTLSNTIKKKETNNVIMGPIGIIAFIGKTASINLRFYWFILALLSLNMGLFNMLPFPFFDGGKALLLTIEKIFNITISQTIISSVSYLFFILFVLFITHITMRDIKKLGE